MKYTKWDRSDINHPKLVDGESQRVLATFDTEKSVAAVGDQQWQLDVDKQTGATATAGEKKYEATGNLKRDRQVRVNLDGEEFVLLAETSKDWIVDDAAGAKIAQFTSANRGTREAIVEFEEPNSLREDRIIALSWFARLVREERLAGQGTALIATLALLTVVAVVVWFV